MPATREVPIILVGLGNVGGTLLSQILDTREVVASRTNLRLVPVGLADVSGLVANPEGLSDEYLHEIVDHVRQGGLLSAQPKVCRLDQIPDHLHAGAILADVTAAPTTAPLLKRALEMGAGVVLANKNPLSGPWADVELFFSHPNLRYEVTVGAGLPVIDTLHYLLSTGDRVTAIEGCMSGTLGYLCAELESGRPYSESIAQARALGYTEPDPREDLSGRDVARKSLILARTAGWPLEKSNLSVEELYPEELASVTTEEFVAAASSQDATYAGRFAEAQSKQKTLRYVARVTEQGGTVGLTAVDQGSPLGALRGPGNYIAFYTQRYNEIPLVTSGPGAGPAVTAAGVLGDIIKLASSG